MSRKSSSARKPTTTTAMAPKPADRIRPVRVVAGKRNYNSSYALDSMAFGMPQLLQQQGNSADAMRFGMWGRTGVGPNDSMLTARRDRNRVREEAVVNPLTRKSLQVLVSNTVQESAFDPGISEYPEMEKRWKRWKRECDPRQEFGWVELMHQCAYLLYRDGAFLVRRRDRFDLERTIRSGIPMQIQVMEIDHLPEMMNNPLLANGNRIVGGVERDPTDRPVAYWLYPRHPDDLIGVNMTVPNLPVRVPADQVIMVKMVGRPGEARPSPWLRTSLPAMRELNNYLDAEGLRKLMAAQRVFWIQTPGMGDDGKIVQELFKAYGPDADIYQDPRNPSTVIVSTPQAGQSGVLPPGYTVKVAEPADVGANFEPFIRISMQHIAAGAGIPHPFLTEDYQGMNDRIYRAITLEFRRTIRFIQQLMIGRLCQPIFEWWVAAGIADNVLALKDIVLEDVYEVDWSTPAPGYINPVQEVAAYVASVEAGFMSTPQVIKELGYDPTRVMIEQKMYEEMQEQLADEPAIAALVTNALNVYLGKLRTDPSKPSA